MLSLFQQKHKLVSFLTKRIAQIEYGTDVLKSQLPHQNLIWLRSMARLNIGQDISALADDVEQLQRLGPTRDVTWARNRLEQRRSANIMGFQPPLSEAGL